MGTLVINCGSSSLKYSLYWGNNKITSGEIERINGKYLEAVKKLRSRISNNAYDTVLHRVVHGAKYSKPQSITPKVTKYLANLIELAPLHQKAQLAVINGFLDKKNIACFDSMFHSEMPNFARIYAIPKSLTNKYSIQRFGFHGLAHQSLANQSAKILNKPLSKLNIITAQLGSGISLCAIKKGISIDTTMGFTPLEGLPMCTRSGSIDPFLVEYISKKEHITALEVIDILEHKSGILGIAGSSDVRDLLKRKDKDAKLALNILTYSIKKQIGAYLAALGEINAVAFGGGISRSPAMIKMILSDMKNLGIKLNKISSKRPSQIGIGKIKVFLLKTNEEVEMLASVRI